MFLNVLDWILKIFSLNISLITVAKIPIEVVSR